MARAVPLLRRVRRTPRNHHNLYLQIFSASCPASLSRSDTFCKDLVFIRPAFLGTMFLPPVWDTAQSQRIEGEQSFASGPTTQEARHGRPERFSRPDWVSTYRARGCCRGSLAFALVERPFCATPCQQARYSNKQLPITDQVASVERMTGLQDTLKLDFALPNSARQGSPEKRSYQIH
jgi:hypothetical protein